MNPIRLPTRTHDFWELASGEARHQATPDTFWIPPLTERQDLRRGQAAKLIFEIEGAEEDGGIEVSTERMWVIVAERLEETYIGILANQPAVIDPADPFYLQRGVEIPFRPEHVIDIDDPPADYAAQCLAEEPRRRWPRSGAAA
jgi:hypothetical protein